MARGFRDRWECASAVRSIWGKEYKRKKGVKLGKRSWERSYREENGVEYGARMSLGNKENLRVCERESELNCER